MGFLPGVLLVGFSVAIAYFPVYQVEPVNAQWCSWTQGDVSQTVTCNFDSLGYVELFFGESRCEAQYRVRVLDAGREVMGSIGTRASNDGWVRFENWDRRYEFTRGKRYQFCFSSLGRDSIRFFYDERNPYPDGALLNFGSSADLCMRVFGVLKVIDSTWWGALCAIYDTVFAHKLNIHQQVRAAGLHLDRMDLPWEWIWRDSNAEFDFRLIDPAVFYSQNTMGCKVIGILDPTAPWASSRFNSAEPCPPRNLYLDIWHPSNYWARYVEAVARHYDTTIIYEVASEPNDTAIFWKVPEFHYHFSNPVQGLCSLYARLCAVATVVIDSVTRGQAKVLIGSFVAMQPSISTRIPPVEMLRYCYRLADKRLWDGVSFHPYQDPGFDLNLFDLQVETLRTVMRANGDSGELWITEIGWTSCGPPRGRGKEQQANWVCEAFVVAQASQSLPQGGYDRICYYSFPARGDSIEGNYGLLDTLFQPKPSYYALTQTVRTLSGKRYNRRVTLGDARDDSVRIYEFEDRLTGNRLWVGWRNFSTDEDTKRTVAVRLAVRCDTLDEMALAYNEQWEVKRVVAGVDGYVEVNLGVRPVFLAERSTISRPDLVVDSVRLLPDIARKGGEQTIKLWVRNIGNRGFDGKSGCRIGFYLNGVLLGDSLKTLSGLSLKPQQSTALTFKIPSIPAHLEAEDLFSVVVNATGDFVELSMANNRAYCFTTFVNRK